MLGVYYISAPPEISNSHSSEGWLYFTDPRPGIYAFSIFLYSVILLSTFLLGFLMQELYWLSSSVEEQCGATAWRFVRLRLAVFWCSFHPSCLTPCGPLPTRARGLLLVSMSIWRLRKSRSSCSLASEIVNDVYIIFALLYSSLPKWFAQSLT